MNVVFGSSTDALSAPGKFVARIARSEPIACHAAKLPHSRYRRITSF